MGQPEKRLVIPPKLRELILQGKCVCYIGSGLSRDAYGAWWEVVRDLCGFCGEDCEIASDSTAEKLLGAAQCAKDHDEKKYYEFLGERFGRAVDRVNPLYSTLLALPFKFYLTTNFDPVIAVAARTSPTKCIFPPQSYPHLYCSPDRRTIRYLHGRIEEGERPARGPVILTQKEFDDAYHDSGELVHCLAPILQNEPILFVGCRLEEEAMRKVFEICKRSQEYRERVALDRQQTPGEPPGRYIFVPMSPKKNDSAKNGKDAIRGKLLEDDRFYYEKQIEIVWYEAVGDDHSAIRNAMDELAQLPSIRSRYEWD